jgi:hypothetical protein
MTVFPLALGELLGHWPSYLVYMLIGFAFGYVLEIAGFGYSRKLAAQFYFKEMTVLKVMFSAIIVAMVLVFLTSGPGLLDYNLIWVNPTYLIPGIVGGLIMGVGFIVGGFCPGTSLVAAATLKVDGIIFVLGVFFGIFLFGETVGFYEDFWYSSYMGRFTLMDLFNVDTGIIVLLIVVAALLAFAGAEFAEKYIGNIDVSRFGQWRYGAAFGLVLLAAAVLVIGQPTNDDRWQMVAAEKQAELDNRAVQIHPGELLEKLDDPKLNVVMWDVRSETDFNQFHILDAEHVPLNQVIERSAELRLMPANTLFVVMSNDEAAATDAWRYLVAESVPNVYILSGGVNHWLETFADDEFLSVHRVADADLTDELAFSFPMALGSRYDAANPNHDVFSYLEFESKVTLEAKRGPASGGCG